MTKYKRKENEKKGEGGRAKMLPFFKPRLPPEIRASRFFQIGDLITTRPDSTPLKERRGPLPRDYTKQGFLLTTTPLALAFEFCNPRSSEWGLVKRRRTNDN
jgi:hypothetical protein